MLLDKTTKEIFLTEDGDFYVSPLNKKIHVTNYRKNEILKTVVRRRLQASLGDYRALPYVGNQLMDFIGEENTEENRTIIKQHIFDELTFDGLLDSTSLTVDVIEEEEFENSIGVSIVTPELEDSDLPYLFFFSYDLRNNKMLFKNIRFGVC